MIINEQPLGTGAKAVTHSEGNSVWTDIVEAGSVLLTVQSDDMQRVSDQAIGFFKGRHVGIATGFEAQRETTTKPTGSCEVSSGRE